MHIEFSKYDFDLKVENDQQFIFDLIRKRHVLLTPEEWVRQHIIHYLIYNYKFPKSLISVEKQLMLNELQKRTDLVLYNRHVAPRLIVECKAPSIKISQKVLDQIARYNLILKVPWLWVTNGKQHILCKIDHQNQTWELHDKLPLISELVS